MTTPITDEELAQHPIPGPHGSRRWCCDECSWKYEERLRERIRADAATIADLRRQVEERDATIARLRAALSPGDLGRFDSSPDACRDSVHDSYYDDGFAAANWLRWCDAWIAIGLAAALVNRLSEAGPGWPARYRDVLGSKLGIPAAEAK